MEPPSPSAGWWRALTLAERATLPVPPTGSTGDRVEVEARARHWREQTGLADDDLFAARLALDGLTPERFSDLLAESADGLRRRFPEPPPWLRLVPHNGSRPAAATPMPLGNAVRSPQAGFLELIAPFLAEAYEAFRRGVDELCAGQRQVPFDPAGVSERLIGKLPAQLLFMVSPALTLELRIASLEERLAGATPEERFRSFVGSLADRGAAREILERYPLLARSVLLRLEQWRRGGLVFLERLCDDYPELGRRFGSGRDPGALVEVVSDLSDRHHGGRTVMIARFASGLRVVYKPRALAIEARFQDFLAWLGERGQAPPLPTLEILDRGDYGWVEHVEGRPCGSRREVRRFYRRQGAYLALLYALEASDFHHENLIARGEEPVLVDLETLLQPRLPTPKNVVDFIGNTVLRTHLLPAATGTQADGPDVSGLGSVRGQTVKLHGVDHPGTDRLQLTRRPAELVAGGNVPALERGGVREEMGPWKHRREVLRGFEDTYRLLARSRDDLLAPEGPLAPLADCRTRVLVRATALYGRLMIMACHPDVMRDALARDRLFDTLWRSVPDRPALARLVSFEREDLERWDIPRFVARPGSRDLRTSTGERVEGFFLSSGWDRLVRRLGELGEEDLERQKHLVHEALRALRPPEEAEAGARTPLPEIARPAAPQRFLDAALAIGRRLETLAVRDGDEISWFHLVHQGDRRHLQPATPELYHGLGGIALFLAHLGAAAGEACFTNLARQALESARRRLACFPECLPGIGAFSGRGGWIYALTHLGILWNEPGLLAEAEAQAPEIAERLEADRAFDLIGGAAGAIAGLLALHRHRPSAPTLDAAVACGEHLLRHARRERGGLAWPSPQGADLPPLTGLAHGTAGIAWALAALAVPSGRRDFAAAARQALAYERSWFSPEKNNWPDLRGTPRDGPAEASYWHAWCHGAPGIGLGRLALLDTLDDPELEGEIRAALASTREDGFGASHCLCHGDLGNLDLFLQAAHRLGDAELGTEARRLSSRILEAVERDGPRCGVGGDGELPGLMTGLAGIGYGLLRAADPRRVPSVLLLETPGGDRG